MKKLLLGVFVAGAFLMLLAVAITFYNESPTKNSEGIKRNFCTKSIEEQIADVGELYEVSLLEDTTKDSMVDYCTYNLKPIKVLLGDEVLGDTIVKFTEGPYGLGVPIPLQCKKGGGHYLVMIEKRSNILGYEVLGCSLASIHSMDKKKQIMKLLKSKQEF